MTKTIKKILSLLLTVAVATSTAFSLSPEANAAGASVVSILGTVVNTRDYYFVNGPVCAYGFFPAELTTYNVGGKKVEITEFGAGTCTELGTNDLSSYVGVTGIYTGRIAKSTKAPYTYSFGIMSFTPIENTSAQAMNTYLTGLGFENTVSESSPTEWFIGSFAYNHTVAFSYHTSNGYSGEITAYILHEDFSPDFGIPSFVPGSRAKAQQVAKMLSQYGAGTISKDKLIKYLNSLQ